MIDGDFIVGFIFGAATFCFLAFVQHACYRSILLSCARAGTAEKLNDGKFYYLVEESIYNDLTMPNQSANVNMKGAKRPG